MRSLERPNGIRFAGGILDRIIESKVERLNRTKRDRPLSEIASIGRHRDRSVSLERQLATDGPPNIIAELKHRSPSKGVIRDEFDPIVIAESYQSAGAAAISVLTEEDFFGGSLDHLRIVGEHVNIPVLRKDFVFDEYQVYEAAEAGADAVLLIAAVLDEELLTTLISLSRELEIDALVEVHTLQEMDRAIRAGARLIGVNNRNLTTFIVDLDASKTLASHAPPEVTLVSESGIRTAEQISTLRSLGYRGFLVGEHLMRAGDPGEELRKLIAQAGQVRE